MNSATTSSPTDSKPSVGFCPFCREAYDGDRCPEHDLLLVRFQQLPKQSKIIADDDEIDVIDFRFGRWQLILSGFLFFLVFFAPLFVFRQMSGEQRVLTVSAFRSAIDRAVNLWSIPLVGGFFFSYGFRRRTLRSLRSMRFGASLMATLPLFSVGYSWFRFRQNAIANDLEFQTEWGAFALVLVSIFALVSALRLGRVPSDG